MYTHSPVSLLIFLLLLYGVCVSGRGEGRCVYRLSFIVLSSISITIRVSVVAALASTLRVSYYIAFGRSLLDDK